MSVFISLKGFHTDESFCVKALGIYNVSMQCLAKLKKKLHIPTLLFQSRTMRATRWLLLNATNQGFGRVTEVETLKEDIP